MKRYMYNGGVIFTMTGHRLIKAAQLLDDLSIQLMIPFHITLLTCTCEKLSSADSTIL